MKRIGVLSDTHGKLREEVVEILKSCDVILHAGDINTLQTLEKLREFAPVYVVRGNADKEWAADLPEQMSEEICGLRIFMVHNKKEIPGDTAGYDLVIYGHSHKYEEKEKEGCFFLNPGSCGPRRFSQPVTMAVVEVEVEEDGSFQVIKQDIVQEQPGASRETEQTFRGEVLTEKTLGAILRDVDKGKTVAQIAEKYEITEETAEQICRLYLTHPGINAAGVKDKMALPKDR